jgi:hypothetical protein
MELQFTASDLRHFTAAQLAAFAAYEPNQTEQTQSQIQSQTVKNVIEFKKAYSGYYFILKNGETVGSIDAQTSPGRIQKMNAKYDLYNMNQDVIVSGTIHECKQFAQELWG